jgi:hypothetical protein
MLIQSFTQWGRSQDLVCLQDNGSKIGFPANQAMRAKKVMCAIIRRSIRASLEICFDSSVRMFSGSPKTWAAVKQSRFRASQMQTRPSAWIPESNNATETSIG